jgi:AcrR family transcriptional regulator
VNRRKRILLAAFELFYKTGYARVSMDAVADLAGVSKKTLYQHFENKNDLVASVIAEEHLAVLARIQEKRESSEESAAGCLTALFKEIEEWAAEPKWLGPGFTRLAMELAADADHPVRHAVHQNKRDFESWLTRELARVGVDQPEKLARQVMALIEGGLSLALIHGDGSYITEAGEAAQRLARQDPP